MLRDIHNDVVGSVFQVVPHFCKFELKVNIIFGVQEHLYSAYQSINRETISCSLLYFLSCIRNGSSCVPVTLIARY